MSVYGPGYGRWRLEVEMDRPAKADVVVNILKPTLNPAEALPSIQKLDRGGDFGARIAGAGATYTLLFNKETLDPPVVTVEQRSR
jgi:hypothetical protein